MAWVFIDDTYCGRLPYIIEQSQVTGYIVKCEQKDDTTSFSIGGSSVKIVQDKSSPFFDKALSFGSIKVYGYQYRAIDNKYRPENSMAIDIADNGRILSVSRTGYIYVLDNISSTEDWIRLPGLASEIAVGQYSNDVKNVYIVSYDDHNNGGGKVRKLTSTVPIPTDAGTAWVSINESASNAMRAEYLTVGHEFASFTKAYTSGQNGY